MNVSNADRAQILVHALPYIKKYTGKILVVKYGGNAMTSEKLKNSVAQDIVLLNLIGVRVVLIHGGGPEITEMLTRMGKETQFVDGLRVTDRDTVDVAQMVLAARINKNLVNLLECCGGSAIGLSGIDGHMIKAEVRDERLGYVGKVTKIDPKPVLDVLEKGYIPVISTRGCDDEGNVYNINADTAAAKIAAALGAEGLITLTDIAGILQDKDDPSTLISHIGVKDTERLIKEGVIVGGMIPKVEACREALGAGVEKVRMMNGKDDRIIISDITSGSKEGTIIRRG